MRLFKNTMLPPTDTNNLKGHLFVGICGTSAMVLVWVGWGFSSGALLFAIIGLYNLAVYAHLRARYKEIQSVARANQAKTAVQKIDGAYLLINQLFVLALFGFALLGANLIWTVLWVGALSLANLAIYLYARMRYHSTKISATPESFEETNHKK